MYQVRKVNDHIFVYRFYIFGYRFLGIDFIHLGIDFAPFYDVCCCILLFYIVLLLYNHPYTAVEYEVIISTTHNSSSDVSLYKQDMQTVLPGVQGCRKY